MKNPPNSKSPRNIDPGEPIIELADAKLQASEDFLPQVLARVDNHHAKLHTVEFALSGAGRVLREYFRLLLAIFGVEPKERK